MHIQIVQRPHIIASGNYKAQDIHLGTHITDTSRASLWSASSLYDCLRCLAAPAIVLDLVLCKSETHYRIWNQSLASRHIAPTLIECDKLHTENNTYRSLLFRSAVRAAPRKCEIRAACHIWPGPAHMRSGQRRNQKQYICFAVCTFILSVAVLFQW